MTNRATFPPRTILFSGHDLRFLRPFLTYCSQDSRYQILLDEHKGHEITQPERCRELLPQADVIFCEWCLGNAVWYSQHKLPKQTLVVRLHLQEMQLPYLDRIRWENVDALVLICPLNLQLILERYPLLQEKLHLIYNPIDSHALNQPKLPGAEFNLGIMGICPMRKAPHLAFELLKQLKERDSRYTLFVKGRHPRDYDWLWRRPAERAYYEQLFAEIESSPYANSVVFETYGDDVPFWFSKIGFILSPSDFEGSHQSVAEGMASGAIPVIRNWAGSDLIYPPKYVVNSVSEAAAALLKWKTPDFYQQETDFCRAYAQENFDQTTVCEKLEALFTSISSSVRQLNTRRQVRALEVAPEAPPVMILCYLPAGFRGGYRIRVEQEVKALVKRGASVHLACLYPNTTPADALPAHRAELEALGCKVHLVPMKGFFDVKLDSADIPNELQALQEILRTHKLQIVHAEALYCARIGLFLKQLQPDLRLVFDCHGTTPEEERMSGAHPGRISAMAQWEKRVLASADLEVFVSEAMNHFYLQQYGFTELPHVVVPCCVAEERFPRETVSPALRLPANCPVIAYLGTLAAWQCGEEMLRLFAQLHRHEPQLAFLLLVPEVDHSKARALISKYGLPDEKVVLGELPHDKVSATLQFAHAGVLLRRPHPVNQVSSPTKFGEYLAAGVPVMMTDTIGDFSSLAATHHLGLVLSSSLLDSAEYPPDEIARICHFVRENYQHHQEVSLACRTTAREHLHWEAASATLLRAYSWLSVPDTPSRSAPTIPSAGSLVDVSAKTEGCHGSSVK